MKKLVLTVSISILGMNTIAEDFQFSAGASYRELDEDFVDYDIQIFSGEVHFDKVSTTKGPLGESVFLDKSSFIGIHHAKTSGGDFRGDFDYENTALNLRAVTNKGIIFEGFYSNLDPDDRSEFLVGAGVYLADTHDVVVSYYSAEGSDAHRFDAELHGYIGSYESGFAYDFGLGYEDLVESDSTSIHLGGDYYFSRSFSLGVDYTFLSGDNSDITTYALKTEWFVLPKVALSASYDKTTYDNEFSQPDTNFIAFAGEVRF